MTNRPSGAPATGAGGESAWLGGYQFADDGNGNWVAVDFASVHGSWSSFCPVPQVVFRNIASPARIAMSARSEQTTAAPTRKLKMVFAPP